MEYAPEYVHGMISSAHSGREARATLAMGMYAAWDV